MNAMTNPDNVGGLPLLQFAVFDEFGKGADDRVWDYGRRCFEAGMKFEGEHGLMTTNAPKRDSAPAGSGEVMDSWQKWPIINRLQMQANDCEDAADENSDAIITALQLKAMASDLREAAALLRKLQQGAE